MQFREGMWKSGLLFRGVEDRNLPSLKSKGGDSIIVNLSANDVTVDGGEGSEMGLAHRQLHTGSWSRVPA